MAKSNAVGVDRKYWGVILNRPGNSGDPLVCIWTPPFMQQYMY